MSQPFASRDSNTSIVSVFGSKRDERSRRIFCFSICSEFRRAPGSLTLPWHLSSGAVNNLSDYEWRKRERGVARNSKNMWQPNRLHRSLGP